MAPVKHSYIRLLLMYSMMYPMMRNNTVNPASANTSYHSQSTLKPWIARNSAPLTEHAAVLGKEGGREGEREGGRWFQNFNMSSKTNK